ncbi:unnamed protein product [Sphagnum jensenii]|uniref:Uncharacterized protein n=1 Tax=Sphagnum jensenii TaxID=128206 RepID=A0ABP0X973_9BRYO
MRLKTDNSHADAWLSKMEVAIEDITSFTAANNLAINQLMEHKVAPSITTKVVSAEKPKGTTMMAKNVRQVVSQAMETLIDVPK